VSAVGSALAFHARRQPEFADVDCCLREKQQRLRPAVLLCANSRTGPSAGPAGPAARPQPALSIGGALPSPLLFPREVSLLAQSHLEEDQEQGCAEAERDECDGQRIARRPADQGGADHTGDDKRRG